MEPKRRIGNMMEADRNNLRDISQIKIEKDKPVKDKMEEMISGEDDFTTHLNDGYVVRVHFSQEDYSATDAFKLYLKQIAQLKY